jgi:hypothetical protein
LPPPSLHHKTISYKAFTEHNDTHKSTTNHEHLEREREEEEEEQQQSTELALS